MGAISKCLSGWLAGAGGAVTSQQGQLSFRPTLPAGTTVIDLKSYCLAAIVADCAVPSTLQTSRNRAAKNEHGNREEVRESSSFLRRLTHARVKRLSEGRVVEGRPGGEQLCPKREHGGKPLRICWGFRWPGRAREMRWAAQCAVRAS